MTPSRTPSSWSTTISVSFSVLGSTTFTRIGTISSLNLPAFCAAAAFWYDWAANSSCCWRVMP